MRHYHKCQCVPRQCTAFSQTCHTFLTIHCLLTTDDHTIIDHIVLLFDNISDDDFNSINANVINNESHRDAIETVFVFLDIPNMSI